MEMSESRYTSYKAWGKLVLAKVKKLRKQKKTQLPPADFEPRNLRSQTASTPTSPEPARNAKARKANNAASAPVAPAGGKPTTTATTGGKSISVTITRSAAGK